MTCTKKFNVLLLGATKTGKTSWLRRQMTGKFSSAIDHTTKTESYEIRFDTNHGEVSFTFVDTDAPVTYTQLRSDIDAAIVFHSHLRNIEHLTLNMVHNFEKTHPNTLVVDVLAFQDSIRCIENAILDIISWIFISSKTGLNCDTPIEELLKYLVSSDCHLIQATDDNSSEEGLPLKNQPANSKKENTDSNADSDENRACHFYKMTGYASMRCTIDRAFGEQCCQYHLAELKAQKAKFPPVAAVASVNISKSIEPVVPEAPGIELCDYYKFMGDTSTQCKNESMLKKGFCAGHMNMIHGRDPHGNRQEPPSEKVVSKENLPKTVPNYDFGGVLGTSLRKRSGPYTYAQKYNDLKRIVRIMELITNSEEDEFPAVFKMMEFMGASLAETLAKTTD